MNRVFISILGFDIYWYAILILIGILIGIYMAIKEAKRIGFDTEFINDLVFYVIPFSLIVVASKISYSLQSSLSFVR